MMKIKINNTQIIMVVLGIGVLLQVLTCIHQLTTDRQTNTQAHL